MMRIELQDGDFLEAVVAERLPVHAPMLGGGVAACHDLEAIGVRAADRGEVAKALKVPLDVLTRAHVVAALVWASDFEAVQLVFDD
jgi:hypothetical protein